MFERFTPAARAAVVRANQHAREGEHAEIAPRDLLMGVLDDEQGLPARTLRTLGVTGHLAAGSVGEEIFGPSDVEALGAIGIDLGAVRRQAESAFGPGALDRRRRQPPGLFGRRSLGGHIPLSVEVKQALELSLREANAEGHRHLGTEHLFLGLIATDRGTTLDLLRRLGVTEDRTGLKRRILAQLHHAA